MASLTPNILIASVPTKEIAEGSGSILNPRLESQNQTVIINNLNPIENYQAIDDDMLKYV